MAAHRAADEPFLARPLQMRLAGNDIACWTNDILSLAKESARGDLNNLVAVLQHQDKLSLEQALNTTATMINRRVSTYVRLRDEFSNSFRSFELPVDDWYKTVSAVHGLGTWVAGSLDWHVLSGRYTHIEHTEPGQHPSYFEPVTRRRAHTPSPPDRRTTWIRRFEGGPTLRLMPSHVLFYARP
ncbi:terpene synthase family protein [Streptomyces sp. NPDC054961]